MKTISFVIEKDYQKNILFDKYQTKMFVRDNIFKVYHLMYDEFLKNGYNVATNDINTIENSDIIIYRDMPKVLPKEESIFKSYLIMKESPLIKPDNFDIPKHKYFHKIFTWSDELVDNKKYFKINYSFDIPKKIPKSFNKEKLCCLIVGNKNSEYSNELYSERKRAIRWFEKNHIEDFDLYGVGWNEYKFKGIKLIRAFNRISIAKEVMYKYFGEYYPSYKGIVVSKFNTMQNYKFAICYENIKNISGYITEKIFDAMFAGCIPIYLGADNIIESIPINCFIDKRKFDTYDKLYQFLNNMEECEYLNYLSNIELFLNSNNGNIFSNEEFVKIVLNIIKTEKI